MLTVRQRQAAAWFDEATRDEQRTELSVYVRETYLSDEAVSLQYGWEDALAFLRWIDEGDYRR